MNLKKIEVIGFKSFADKLALNFDKGVTCIVGPNGCGKSNVSDAIRWVLGEQSAKSMRGKTMQEVIFVGTTARRPAGYCEVSLIFDNSTKTYDVPFEELIITRKLYRSGDSEYYINKEVCRLKDIIDLFRDTGIGKDGYSVVGQGKVDSFLSAKPEERRQVFEEAAGISKYKAKRLESQRKLDRAYDNLLRIGDKIAVYEQRLEPLQKQSKVTLRARELRSKQKEIEVNSFLFQTENSETQKKELKERLTVGSKRMRDLTTQRDAISLDYQNTQEELKGLDIRYREMTDRRLELSVASSRLEGAKNLQSQKLDTVRSDIAKLTAEIEEKETAIHTHSASVETSNLEKQQVMKDFHLAKQKEEALAVRYEELEQLVQEQKREIDTANELLLDSVDMLGKINGGLIKLKTEKDTLELYVAENKDKITERKSALNDTQKKLNDIVAQLDASTADRNEKLDIKKEVEKTYAEKLAALEEAQDTQMELKSTIVKSSADVENLEQRKRNFEGFDKAVSFLLNHESQSVKSKLIGVLGNLITAPPEYALAIEVALGGAINNIVTNDQESAAYLIDCLDRAAAGRATFLPLTTMRPRVLENQFLPALDEDGVCGLASDLVKFDRQVRRAVDSFLGRVVVVEDKATANRIASKYRSAFRIVTMDGAHYATNGSMTGGKEKNQDAKARILSVDTQLQDAQRTLIKAQKAHELVMGEINEYKGNLREMEATSKVLDSIISKLDKEIVGYEQRKIYLETERNRFQSEIDGMQKQNEEHLKNISVKSHLYNIESGKVSDTSTQRTGADELRIQLADELKRREIERNTANKEHTDILIMVRSLDGKLDDIEKSINVSKHTVERLKLEVLDAKARLCTRQAEEERLITEIEQAALLMADNVELIELQNTIEQLEEYRLKLGLRQEEMRRDEMKYSEMLSGLSATVAKLEAGLERLDSDMAAITERVREEYGLDYENAKEFRLAEFDFEKAQEEIKVIRRDLAKLGDINERAVEDLEEMSVEYRELKLHYDDVTEAKNSLEETIRDLTVKMETNFKESFEKIQTNFCQVFTELFGGGTGRLELDWVRGTSILDAGIEIYAEPPGKKLRNIDLLSGGERAMTAIAIIFSIIKLHPMPFCVLDEVDAPLDETNAHKYAKYLKKFSKDTQFIIVSHRKPTMELADVLYGITMQEKGVSKFYQVQLADAVLFSQTGTKRA